MRNIYTGIDIGSSAIKVLVLEKFDNHFNVLASSKIKAQGIKKGIIVDVALAANSIKECIKDVENKIGTKITKALVNVPIDNCEFNIVNGVCKIENEDHIVLGSDMDKCFKNAVDNNKEKDKEVVTIMPIEYDLDNVKLNNPIKQKGDYLKIKALISMIPKVNIYPLIKVFEMVNVEIVDITFIEVGDYFATRNEDLDKKVVAMVNIGNETTKISIFNKSIMIKNTILEFGSRNIDKDIAFVYKLPLSKSRELKEKFAVASPRYADTEEICECMNKFEEKITIHQEEIADVVGSRLSEMLKNIKNEIKNLTNKEIGYIIITGGVTDMLGFASIAEDIMGSYTTILSMNVIGIRENKYSGCFGMIKYFDYKLSLKDSDYSMFSDNKIKEMLAIKNKNDNTNVLLKIFDRFLQ